MGFLMSSPCRSILCFFMLPLWGGGGGGHRLGLLSLTLRSLLGCVGSLVATPCTFSMVQFLFCLLFAYRWPFVCGSQPLSDAVNCCLQESCDSGLRWHVSVLAAQSGLRWRLRVLFTAPCALSYSFLSLGFLRFQSAALCHLVLLSLSPLPLLF